MLHMTLLINLSRKPVWNSETSVLMVHNWGEQSVRDMFCLLHSISAVVVGNGVHSGKADGDTGCGPVFHVVDSPLLLCCQRVPLYRTSLVRQTWTTTLPPTLST